MLEEMRQLATTKALGKVRTRYGLSRREMTAMYGLLTGEKIRTTAARAGVAETTMKNYRRRAYVKLRVQDGLEAVMRLTTDLVRYSNSAGGDESGR